MVDVFDKLYNYCYGGGLYWYGDLKFENILCVVG